MRFFVSLLFLALLATACDSGRVYEFDQELKNRNWRSTDTLAFEFGIRDLGKTYNLYYNIRNSLDYPYARLFIQYSLEDSARTVLSSKLVSAFLFDQKTGRPQGSSGLGDVYDHRFPLLEKYAFKHPGRYKLRLQQFMRTDSLKGMLAVGVRVEEVGRNGDR
jgi:gliding motility-associated lipoprotein GldH